MNKFQTVEGVLSRPFSPRSSAPSGPFVRVNGKIRAREVRVIGVDGKQLGVLSLGEALTMARTNTVDLVEIAPNATPPVCRLVDFGKYRYEQAKKDKESKKHQHANKVKEVQLSPKIDPHDLGVKIGHAIDFLCEDMKVKVTLKFRGRENAHTEFGFQVVQKFLGDIASVRASGFSAEAGRSRHQRDDQPLAPQQASPASRTSRGSTRPRSSGPSGEQSPTRPGRCGARQTRRKPTPGGINNPFVRVEANR